MIFSVEKFNKKKHYPILCAWWEKQNFPPPPLYLLPPDGVVVLDKSTQQYIYAGFLYLTNVKAISWIEYVVANPFVAPVVKRGGLDELIEGLSKVAKQATRGKAKILFTSTNNMSFVNSLKKSNFEVGDKNMYQLIKSI